MPVYQPRSDLRDFINTNFAFATVNALIGGSEALTEKPPIYLEEKINDTIYTYTDGLRIEVGRELRLPSILSGHYYKAVYNVDVAIVYEPRTDKTDEMVQAISSHLESLFNASNYGTTAPTWYYTIASSETFHSISETVMELTIKAEKGLVDGTS